MPSRIANDNDVVVAVRGGGAASGATDTDTNPPTLSNSISAIDKSPPVPPPNVPPIQLKMWLTIIQRRKKQISKLSNTYLLSFANDIILDLLASQENDNDEQDQNKENSEDQVLTNPLLITGYYSTYLLMVYPPPSNISIDDVILHLLALFYRSVDERLTSVSRLQESLRFVLIYHVNSSPLFDYLCKHTYTNKSYYLSFIIINRGDNVHLSGIELC